MPVINPADHFEVRPNRGCLLHATADVDLVRWIGTDDGMEGAFFPTTYTVTTDGLLLLEPGVYAFSPADFSGTVTKQDLNDCEIATLNLANEESCVLPQLTPLAGYYEQDTGKCLPVFGHYECVNGAPVFSYVYFNPPEKGPIMANEPIAAPAPDEDDCEMYASRFVPVDSTSGVTDGTTLLDFLIANDPGTGEYETYGAIDIATDEVISVTLGPRPEDGADTITVDGNAQGGWTFNSALGGWANAAGTVLAIDDPCNFLGSFCLKRCVDKQGNPVTA